MDNFFRLSEYVRRSNRYAYVIVGEGVKEGDRERDRGRWTDRKRQRHGEQKLSPVHPPVKWVPSYRQ